MLCFNRASYSEIKINDIDTSPFFTPFTSVKVPLRLPCGWFVKVVPQIASQSYDASQN